MITNAESVKCHTESRQQKNAKMVLVFVTRRFPVKILAACLLGLIYAIFNLPEEGGETVRKTLVHRQQRYLNSVQDSSYNDSINLENQRRYEYEELLLHPRVAEYCQFDQTPQRNTKNISAGYRLVQTHVILSPGHSMAEDIREVTRPAVNCFFDQSDSTHPKVATYADTISMYNEVQNIKDGFKSYQMYPFHNLCKSSQMTPLGIEQQIILGDNLQKVYKELVPKSGANAFTSNVNFFSVSDESSYQTILAFLHGFLSEKHFSNVFMHKSMDSFCIDEERCNCPKAERYVANFKRAVNKGQYIFKTAHKSTNHAADKLHNLDLEKASFLEIVRITMNRVCNKLKPVFNDKDIPLNRSIMDWLFTNADEYRATLSKNSQFLSFVRLHTYPFFHMISKRIESLKNNAKFHVYSGQESLLIFIASALEIPLQSVLKPGSYLAIEVYEKERQARGRLHLRFLLNGEDMTPYVKICNDNLRDGMCRAKYFVGYYLSDIWRNAGYSSYEEACII